MLGIINGNTHILASENDSKMEAAGNNAGGFAGVANLTSAYFYKITNYGSIENKSNDGANYGSIIGLVEDMKYILLSAVKKRKRWKTQRELRNRWICWKNIIDLIFEDTIEIVNSYVKGEIELSDNPRSDGAYSSGMVGWIDSGSIYVSQSYSAHDILSFSSNGTENYDHLGAFAGYVGSSVKKFQSHK